VSAAQRAQAARIASSQSLQATLVSLQTAYEDEHRLKRPVVALVQLIASSSGEDLVLCFRAMQLLCRSVRDSASNQLVAFSCGAMDVLVSMLECGPVSMRIQACVTLGDITCDCPAIQEEACRKQVVRSVCQLMNELGMKHESRAELHQCLEGLSKNHSENRRLCEQYLDDENFRVGHVAEDRAGATAGVDIAVCPALRSGACRNPGCDLHHYSPAFYRTGAFHSPPPNIKSAVCVQGGMCEIVLCGFKHAAPKS